MLHRVSSLFALVLVFAGLSWSQEAATTNERLARLEEGQKAINQRIDDMRVDMNMRFEDMNTRFDDMNTRFEDLNRKFNWLYMLLAAIIALNGAMVGSVIWMARQERPMSQKQYDEILDREVYLEREIRDIKSRLDRLESA